METNDRVQNVTVSFRSDSLRPDRWVLTASLEYATYEVRIAHDFSDDPDDVTLFRFVEGHETELIEDWDAYLEMLELHDDDVPDGVARMTPTERKIRDRIVARWNALNLLADFAVAR